MKTGNIRHGKLSFVRSLASAKPAQNLSNLSRIFKRTFRYICLNLQGTCIEETFLSCFIQNVCVPPSQGLAHVFGTVSTAVYVYVLNSSKRTVRFDYVLFAENHPFISMEKIACDGAIQLPSYCAIQASFFFSENHCSPSLHLFTFLHQKFGIVRIISTSTNAFLKPINRHKKEL